MPSSRSSRASPASWSSESWYWPGIDGISSRTPLPVGDEQRVDEVRGGKPRLLHQPPHASRPPQPAMTGEFRDRGLQHHGVSVTRLNCRLAVSRLRVVAQLFGPYGVRVEALPHVAGEDVALGQIAEDEAVSAVEQRDDVVGHPLPVLVPPVR